MPPATGRSITSLRRSAPLIDQTRRYLRLLATERASSTPMRTAREAAAARKALRAPTLTAR